ncbi:hypothetical protein BJ138DRAFT_922026 [Hygrophoropsis aurantiaca]|uniref:Uncharacterized protein n=1 Tax=Hygrophoropsis aurantiaca TaxID=72124 RepID=A0ACB8AD90_9AGAM|nr:hypothetical protein BJ138DRAFT_922026 [Hygrophoropsis aurantiaca]
MHIWPKTHNQSQNSLARSPSPLTRVITLSLSPFLSIHPSLFLLWIASQKTHSHIPYFIHLTYGITLFVHVRYIDFLISSFLHLQLQFLVQYTFP